MEKPPKSEPKDSDEEETNSHQSEERPRRDRKAPNYFGNPVLICGIEQPPEVIKISSSNEN